ncbi:MAG: acyl-CoA thioesterase [Candidatus Cloacimonetes bacterium]|nr:acyl-CoA thioesterase [Candidatus Cloacimonadota bacterium]
MKSELNFCVRYAETDQMGVANHARYLDWFSEGRVEWLKKKGILYSEWEKNGIVLPVIDLSVRYHQSVRFQENLHLITELKKGNRRELQFEYSLLRDGVLCAKAVTRHFFLIDGKVSRLSEELSMQVGI